ncbi:bis(5'-nucleosyl)-tetraphosphatase (symmetrical) YqeK [Bacillus solimangrovi]|uniref:bis(5'-nucleosyl)-tetraphosphatase (symmetrical) n=1 Tax=Bacillus solimangrovi TaxID=1305675 RepID=A0A1E5LHY0_9BACI|nr:bis(5'-nucleosyl)-tetraphosphatase (symmetrical) YqeK [Bacillus solimangrovi]OEH93675.1 phosphohydrolase [Bacillus solimangrovi]
MDRNLALEIVKEQLTEHRYEHTLGVAQTSIELAERYDANVKKAELAAIFHDYAKFRPKEEMKQIIIEQQMPQDLLEHGTELWHAPVGAYLVENEVGITDQNVLQAIRFHTSGHEHMTILDKVVFLADYIEPGRKFPGVEEVRELARKDINKAIVLCLQNTMIFLLKKRVTIYPDTLNTYNTLLKQMKKGGS